MSLFENIVASFIVMLVIGPAALIFAAMATGVDPRKPWADERWRSVAAIVVTVALAAVIFMLITLPFPRASRGLIEVVPPSPTLTIEYGLVPTIDPWQPVIWTLTPTWTATPTHTSTPAPMPSSTPISSTPTATAGASPTRTAVPPRSPSPPPSDIPDIPKRCFTSNLSITRVEPSASAISLRSHQDIAIYGAAQSAPGGRKLERFFVEALVGSEITPSNDPIRPWHPPIKSFPYELVQGSLLAKWSYEDWQTLFNSPPLDGYQPSSLVVWLRVRGSVGDGNAEVTSSECLVSVVLYR
jgi:hypothetical protein